MGTETIKDVRIRKNWENFISLAHSKLRERKIDIEFSSFKNDGSYAKAKTEYPAVYFAFAQDTNRTWVELELKARTLKGKRYSQNELYTFLKTNFKNIEGKNSYPITWNEEDLKTSPRNQNGLDIRIKIYLINNDQNSWINAMIYLTNSFNPILKKSK
jgi:hypothetical protein